MTKIAAHGKKDGINAVLLWVSDDFGTISASCEDEGIDEPYGWEDELSELQLKEYSFSGDYLAEDDPMRIICIMNDWFDEKPSFISDPPMPILIDGYVDYDAENGAY